MKPLSALTGKHLRWRSNMGITIPRQAQVAYQLFDGETAVMTADAEWKVLDHYDLAMHCAEGSFEVHIPLSDPGHRPAAVWKAGHEATSIAGFVLEAEGSFTMKGWIDTASGRRLVWKPTHTIGYEYSVLVPGRPPMLTLAGLAGTSIGGNPGHMLLADAESTDPELPALVALSLALACEQTLFLHRDHRYGVRW